MADVNAIISIDIDSSNAYAELRKLQSQITSFNNSFSSANASAAAQAAALNKALKDGINATGMFEAKMVPVTSSVDRFSNALEKNKLTIGEYTRYAASQLPGMSRIFRDEFNVMERVATERVKKINAQYMALGRTAKGVQEALQITPTGLAKGYATDLAIATQRQQMFNKLIDDGSTKLLNWGKNTQWAGRQLMVGFSLPLAALGAAAAKTFMELDKASTAFERVYGDLSTTTAEMERNKDAVELLGKEYTKYGIAVKDTIELSARVAATGLQNEDMLAATEQTLRFATLGQMDYNEALDATISLQSAFNVESKNLGTTIDYLNAVENQTVLTIQDMAAAIPRVAPVIQGLGGDVKDLAVMMTAMREGGVTAENAANALKSGLASLINPTNRAQESMAKLGIDMQGIINANKGDLLATVQAFGQALSKVSEFEQQQALEQIFGKYQYARMGALFTNIADGASQASRAMDLAGMSMSELAQLSERELSKIEESTTVKFQAAMEQLKLAIAPLGEAFLKGVMPIMEFVTKIAEAFNNLPDPIKNVVAVVTGLVAGLGPVFLMTIGLIGNGFANLIKGIQFFRKTIARIKGDSSSFERLADSELEAKVASDQLEGSVVSLTSNLNLQRRAVANLVTQYGRYAQAAGITAGAVARRGRGPELKMANGGVVPGTGSGDKVPALLEPGETVVTKKASQKYAPVIAAMNSGTLPGYVDGLNPSGSYITGQGKYISPIAVMQPAAGGNQSSVGVSREVFSGDVGQAAFSAAGKAAVDLATRMETGARYAESAVQALDPLDDLFNRMHGVVSDQLQSSATIDEALDKSEVHIKAILSEYIKQEVLAGRMTKEQAKALRVGTRMLLANERTSARAGLTRAERVDVREGAFHQTRTQTVQTGSSKGSPLTMFRSHLPALTRREFLRRGIEEPSDFGSWQRSHLRSVAQNETIPGIVQPRVQMRSGTAEDAAEIRRIATEAQSARSAAIRQAEDSGDDIARSSLVSARRAIGAQSPAEGFAEVMDDAADGMLVGAKRSSATAAKSGEVLGQSAREAYKAQRSAERREKRNRGQLAAAGVTGSQQDRAIRRLRASEAKAEQARLVEARKAQKLAEQAARQARIRNIAETAVSVARQSEIKELTRMQKISQRMGGIGSSIAGRAGTLGMGLGMASMIPMMAQNEQGQFMGMNANNLAMGMGTAGMALDFVGLAKFAGSGGILGKVAAGLAAFSGPLAIATVAIGAAAIAIKVWRNNVDDSAKAAAKLGANLGMSANAANNMAEMLGKQTPAQIEAARLAGMTVEESQQIASEFQYIFESDAGKKFIDELKGATSNQRFKMLGDYLRTAIATGMMDQTQAQNFGKAIAMQIGDGVLGAQIGTAIKDQVAGLEGMLNLANERAAAIQQSSALSAVNAGTAGTEQSSTVIGAAIQGIQDFANVSAIAKQEYDKGIISYQEMLDALNRAADAQNRYTDSLMRALTQGDVGGNVQALKDQAVNAGLIDPDKFDEVMGNLESTAKERPMPVPYGVDGSGLTQMVPLSPKELALLRTTWIALLAEGMDPDEAARVAQSAFRSQELIDRYKDLVESIGKTAAAQVMASTVGKINVKQAGKDALNTAKASGVTDSQALAETKDLAKQEARAFNQMLNQVKIDYADVQGETRELEAYLAKFSEEELLVIVPKLAEMDPAQVQKWVQDNAKMGQYISDELTKKVQSASDYSGNEADAIAKASATNLWTAEELETNIKIILTEDPPNLDEKLPRLIGYAEELSAIPQNIRSLIGIDIANKDDLSKYGPLADNLKALVPAIEAIPEGSREIAVDFMFNQNGKPKDPMQFAKDWKTYQKALSGLSSDKLSVRKKASIQVITEIFNQNGVKITPDGANDLMKKITDDLGISEKEFLQLPTDTISKVFQIQAKLNMSKESLDAAREYYKWAKVNGSPQQADLAFAQWKTAQTAFAAAQKSAAAETESVVAAGEIEGGNNLPSGSDSGGGDKSNPWKDFLSGLLDQVRTFSDINANLKNLLSGKNDFFSLLKKNNGVDDKIRKMGLSPLLAEQIRGMAPKDAEKVLSKIKQVGKRKVEDIALANQVNVEKDALTTRVTQASAQRRASMSLANRGVKGDVIASITSDPTASATYLSFVKKVNNLENQMGEASGRRRKQLKKEWQDAKKELREYLALYSKANVSERAQAYQDDKTVRGYDVESKGAVLQRLKAAGISQSEIDAIMSNGAVVGKLNDAVRAGTGFNNVLREQLALIQQEAQMEWNLKSPQEQLSELISAQEQIINLQKARDELIRITPLQNEIDAIQKVIDGYQEELDVISRKIELEQRNLEVIDDQISKLEEEKDKINELYDERLKALDAIEKANERIYAQQRGQLSIAQALSMGDVAGAAKAAQDLQIQMAKDRQQSTRDALELARQRQLEQIDQQINNLKDQRKVIEEEIKRLQLDQRRINDAIYSQQQLMKNKQNEIKKIQDEINAKYQNQELALASINNQLAIAEEHWREISRLAGLAGAAVGSVKSIPETSSTTSSSLSSTNNGITANSNGTYTVSNGMGGVMTFKKDESGNWVPVATGGLIKNYAGGGSVLGDGARDSVKALLTPGEFVMRKASVQKYGLPMLSAMNMGAMPRYNIPAGESVGIQGSSANSSSSVYNYEISVNVPNSNASPDEIANVVLGKIKMQEDKRIRSNRY